MEDIRAGIRRFREEVFPGRRDQFEALADGQSPELLLVTCSDSRIDPSLFTQTDPGQLFVIRNAGNFVPPRGEGHGGEAATVQFGIEALGIRDIAVCGHVRCGAMAAVNDPASAEALPSVHDWIRHGAPARERKVDVEGSDDPLLALIAANTLVQLDHLRTYDFVADAEARGDLTLHAWVYDFVTGEVLVGDAEGRFRPLRVAAADPGAAA